MGKHQTECRFKKEGKLYLPQILFIKDVQLRAKQTAPLVNKHYENEVTLR